MQQYHDDTFGPIQEGREVLKRVMQEEGEFEKTKAIHFGSRSHLERIKSDTDEKRQEKEKIANELEAIQQRLTRLERQQKESEDPTALKVYPADALQTLEDFKETAISRAIRTTLPYDKDKDRC